MKFDRRFPKLRHWRKRLMAPFRGRRDRSQIHDYWRRPRDENRPETYAADPGVTARSAYLLDLLRRHARPTDRVLEVGCNIGRNLHHLHEGGFRQLEALEINAEALEMLRKTFPDTAGKAGLHLGTAESILPKFETGRFGVIYSMAVLIHIHPDSETIFDEIARLGPRCLVTIEDEFSLGGRHFARNYQKVFEARGFRQVETLQPVPGLEPEYVSRVFARVDRA